MTALAAPPHAGADLPSRARVALRERPLIDVVDLAIRFCASHASRLVFSDDARARDALRASRRALPGIALARTVQLLALLACSLLGGLPWLWAGPRLFFVIEVLVLERPGAVASLARAARLAKARFGEALSALLLFLLARLACAIFADLAGREVLVELLEVRPPPSAFVAGGSWLALAGWWSAVPLVASARFLVYLDVRTRTEGWDIQTRFAAIAAAEPRP